MRPLVSVLILTYNHKDFITQAIESTLNQKTNFDYEILIGDDCSNDGAIKIITDYSNKHSKQIKLITSEKNIGAVLNEKRLIDNSNGKYIALLEGDDYWTDSFKLQKQVDFLENNPEYSYCTHRFNIVNIENEIIGSDYYPELFLSDPRFIEINTSNFFTYWLSKTLTAMFKKELFDSSEINRYKYYRDVHLFYILLRKGNGACLNFFGGNYRIHTGGVWSKQNAIIRLQDSFNAYKELYTYNKNDIFLERSYFGTYYRYLNKLIEEKKHPYFDYRLIKLITIYSFQNKSLKTFLKFTYKLVFN